MECAKNQTNKIEHICKPFLDGLGIKHFGYFRQFCEGKYFAATNTIKLLDQSGDGLPDNGSIFQSEIVKSKNDSFRYFLWPLDKRTEDVTLDLFCSSNLWNGVSIYRRNGDSVESWEFAGERKDEGLQNLFINEKELIEKFIRYFNQTAGELIDCSDEEKLVTYTNEVNMVPIEDHLLQQKELLLESLDLKTELAIQGRYGIVSISYQQAKCLDHLANGKTIKEIAKAMALSPRTIEDYLRKIKEKIGYTSRCDLVQAYQNRSA